MVAGYPLVRHFPVWLAFLSIGFYVPASAFEGERPVSPANGEAVPAEVHYYIQASGKPAADEFYRIEVATDSDFEDVVATYDQRKAAAGWVKATQFDIQDVPPELQPVHYDGIHFRCQQKLADGEYFWRAAKSKGGGAFELLSGVNTFSVDTQAPAPVNDLTVYRDGNGVRLRWSYVGADVNGNPEQVAGYRVYHFEKLLKRFPLMTRYLEAETQDNQLLIPGTEEKPPRIAFFFVQAVDQVGNEIGRRRPTRIGEFETAFNPPDLDALTDLDNLRRMNRDARPKK